MRDSLGLKNERDCETPTQKTEFYKEVDSPRIKCGNSALTPCDVSLNRTPYPVQENRPSDPETVSSVLQTSSEHSIASSPHHVYHSNMYQQQQLFQTESVLPLQSQVLSHSAGFKHESEDQISQLIDNTSFINLKITSSIEESFLPSLPNLRKEKSDNYLTNLQPVDGYIYDSNCNQQIPESRKCIKPVENQSFPEFSHLTGMYKIFWFIISTEHTLWECMNISIKTLILNIGSTGKQSYLINVWSESIEHFLIICFFESWILVIWPGAKYKAVVNFLFASTFEKTFV